ncbi:GNAT family N-acetyltransferase [Myroides odoratus]
MTSIALTQVDKKEIVAVLNASFADYIVPLQLTLEQLEFKIAAENIQLDLSVGLVEDDRLVGFMLHAINTVDGKLTAYNAATGVIPSHRGQGLVGKMYEFLLQRLQPLKVEQLVLEVIENNHAAIRAYEKMEYHMARKLGCFEGEAVTAKRESSFDIKTLADFNWPVFCSFWEIQPSWQYTVSALEKSKDRCCILGAYDQEQLVGYIIFNPTTKRILQLAVAKTHRRKGIATQFIQMMQERMASTEVYVYNVDVTSVETTAFFHQLNLKSELAQFEMKRLL